jgi:hypothetical protein
MNNKDQNNRKDEENLAKQLIRSRLDALERLVKIAQGPTGQSMVAAEFLMGLYDGAYYKFDLTSLRGLDQQISDDCIEVLTLDKVYRREVHSYFTNGDEIFQKFAKYHNLIAVNSTSKRSPGRPS